MDKPICIIPARGGSKRLPGKNLKELGGHPLIAWTIAAAFRAECFHDVIVTSDSSDILTVAESYGASPWERQSPSLSEDDTPATAAIMEVVDKRDVSMGRGYAVMLPTWPIRRFHAIATAIEHAIATRSRLITLRFSGHPCSFLEYIPLSHFGEPCAAPVLTYLMATYEDTDIDTKEDFERVEPFMKGAFMDMVHAVPRKI